jgi:hypothetical protein
VICLRWPRQIFYSYSLKVLTFPIGCLYVLIEYFAVAFLKKGSGLSGRAIGIPLIAFVRAVAARPYGLRL